LLFLIVKSTTTTNYFIMRSIYFINSEKYFNQNFFTKLILIDKKFEKCFDWKAERKIV